MGMWVEVFESQPNFLCTKRGNKKKGKNNMKSSGIGGQAVIGFITKEVRTGTQAGQKAGADAEAIEGCSLLACLPWLAQPALL